MIGGYWVYYFWPEMQSGGINIYGDYKIEYM